MVNFSPLILSYGRLTVQGLHKLSGIESVFFFFFLTYLVSSSFSIKKQLEALIVFPDLFRIGTAIVSVHVVGLRAQQMLQTPYPLLVSGTSGIKSADSVSGESSWFADVCFLLYPHGTERKNKLSQVFSEICEITP